MAHFQVIGDTISGNILLLVFRKLGLTATIDNRFSAQWPALVVLPPNALKVLYWLNLENEILKHAIRIDRHDITNHLGQPFRVMGPGFYTDPSGLSIQLIEGEKLRAILHLAVEESLFWSFPNPIDEANVLPVTAVYNEHEINQPGLKHTGFWVIQGFSDFILPITIQTSITDVWMKGGRLRICPLNNHKVFWQAKIPRPGGLLPPDDPLNWMKSHFLDAENFVRELLNHLSDYHWCYDEVMLIPTKWKIGDAIRVGEARFQLTNDSLQGHALFMEEAFHLAHYLAKTSDYHSAIIDYESKNNQKLSQVIKEDWTSSQLHRYPYGRILMKLLLQYLPEKAMKTQLNYWYGLQGLDGY